jgi:glycosyltransferase involved in cell wall biosynthesis
MRKLPLVSVIVPTYHDWERLSCCLDSLIKQTYPDRLLEVLVVNNDSADHPPEFVLPDNFRVLTEDKPGSYAARNKGISVAKGDVFAFIDSDCIPHLDWIEKAVERLLQGADRLAGHIDIFPQFTKPNAAEFYDMVFGFDQENAARNGLSVTANMITWSSLFSQVGSFDHTLLSGGDVEWSRRASGLGFNIEYAPDVIVKHPARSTLQQLLMKRLRVSAKKTKPSENRPKYNMVNAYSYVYKKRLIHLFSGEAASRLVGLNALIIAVSLRLYSKSIKILFKLKLIKSSRV